MLSIGHLPSLLPLQLAPATPKFVKCPASTSFRLFASCTPTPSALSFYSPPLHRAAQFGTRAQMQSTVGNAEWGEVFEWEIKGAGEKEVWAVTGDFLGLEQWLPTLVKSCELVAGEPQKPGCVRKTMLYPEPYTNIIEKLLSIDDSLFHYSYSMLEGTTTPGFSLMKDYVGTFKLSPLPHHPGTLLQWGYSCRPVSTMSQEDARTTVFSLFQAAVAALQPVLSLPDDSISLLSNS